MLVMRGYGSRMDFPTIIKDFYDVQRRSDHIKCKRKRQRYALGRDFRIQPARLY